MVDEMCWTVPLYNRTRFVAVNKDIIDPDTIFCGRQHPAVLWHDRVC